jgi:hypothetical protein
MNGSVTELASQFQQQRRFAHLAGTDQQSACALGH